RGHRDTPRSPRGRRSASRAVVVLPSVQRFGAPRWCGHRALPATLAGVLALARPTAARAEEPAPAPDQAVSGDRAARLAVRVRGTPRDTVRLPLDGEELRREDLGRSMTLGPGRHEVGCTGAPGCSASRPVVLAEGDRTTLWLELEPGGRGPASPPSTPPSP